MKKLFLAGLMALISVSLSAQVFVGGSASVDTDGSKVGDTVIKGDTNIYLRLNGGYILQDNFLVGARLGLGPNFDEDTNGFDLSLAPYVRYRVFELGPVGVWAEAELYAGLSTSKTTHVDNSVSKTNTLSFGLGLAPVLTYPLNEHITLEATLDFVSLDLSTSTIKGKDISPDGSQVFEDDPVSFSNLFVKGGSTSGLVSLGFTYKF